MVSTADFPKLRKPADSLQVTDPKTGETGYRVGVEVFHQLHCLNLLRMSTYPEHYTKVSWSDTAKEASQVRAHLGMPFSSFSSSRISHRPFGFLKHTPHIHRVQLFLANTMRNIRPLH
jgi:hypothetical protein